MEAPAILVGVLLGKLTTKKKGDGSLKGAIHETLFGRSIFLLVGALVVGALCGEAGMKKVEPLFVAPFQGALAFFLLEMGVVAGKRMGDLKKAGLFRIGFGIIVPLLNGALGVTFGKFAGLELGGATLFRVLAASASVMT